MEEMIQKRVKIYQLKKTEFVLSEIQRLSDLVSKKIDFSNKLQLKKNEAVQENGILRYPGAAWADS